MSFFGCFRRDNKKDKNAAQRTIQQQPKPLNGAASSGPPSGSKNARVLPHQTNSNQRSYESPEKNQVQPAAQCTNCGKPVDKADGRPPIPPKTRTNSVTEGGPAASYSINDDGKKPGKVLCKSCHAKEGGYSLQPGQNANLEVLSSGSHRDDVSQSTMAARSNKTGGEGNSTMKGVGSTMNQTITTLDGSDKSGQYAPKMVSTDD